MNFNSKFTIYLSKQIHHGSKISIQPYGFLGQKKLSIISRNSPPQGGLLQISSDGDD